MPHFERPRAGWGKRTAAEGGRSGLGIPVPDSIATLPPTAQRVLQAARSILVERGYPALTLANIQQVSGENAAAVSYYFGSKAGLVEAVADAVFWDECCHLAENLHKVSPEERIERLLEGMQDRSTRLDFFTVFFEILPQAMREYHMHDGLLTLYERYLALHLEWIETDEGAIQGLDRETAVGLAAIISAVTDGLGLQCAIDSRRFDVSRPYAVFAQMLRAYLDVTVGQSGKPNT